MKLSFHFECPSCNSTDLQRIHRKWWMRLLPSSRYYHCAKCRCDVLILMHQFAFSL